MKEQYTIQVPSNKKMAQITGVINKLGIRGDKLLDVGCADGELTIFLKGAFQADEVFGIEISPQRAQAARTKGINVTEMDVENENFPFSNATFDVIINTEVMEHLYNPSHLLREMSRCLKPGGHGVIIIPNLASWHSRILLLLGYQPYSIPVSPEFHDLGVMFQGSWESSDHSSEGGKEHVRFTTLRGLKELVKVHQFRILRTTGIRTYGNHLRQPLRTSFSFLDSVATKFPGLASFIMMIIEKSR